MAVNDDVSNVRQHLGGAILAKGQLKKGGRFVEEPRRDAAFTEVGVTEVWALSIVRLTVFDGK